MSFRVAFVVFLLSTLPGCAQLGLLSPLERTLLFHPDRYPAGDWQPDGLTFEDAYFDSADGTRLHGWFVPHAQPRATVLYLHGNAGNITGRAEILRQLHDRHKVAVMIFDYRGYGRSAGAPNEQGILNDARAARAWLAQRTRVAESDIVLIGRSLGGGVAVDLAAKDGARGLVLASTFTSLPDVGGYHFRWLPTQRLMSHRLDSLAKIPQYSGPLLQCHGDADKVVPYQFGSELFKAASGPKQFVTIPGGGHNDPWSEEFHETLDHFFATIAAQNATLSAAVNTKDAPHRE